MSVLSELSQRLKRDLADTARASIDPTFSRQLTEANFRDKAFQQERKAALEDQARVRQQQLADRADAEQLATQKFAVGKLFDIAMNDETGEGWTRYMKNNTSGLLRPDVQQLSDLLADGAGGLSLDVRKFQYKQRKDVADANRQERDYLAGRIDAKNANDLNLAKSILAEDKEDRLMLEAFRKETQEDQSSANIKQFFTNLPDGEGQKYLSMIAKGDNSYTHSAKVLDMYATDFNNDLDRRAREINAKIVASKVVDPLPTTANDNVIKLAEVFTAPAIEKLPDNQKDIAKEHLSDFNRLVAQIALDSARRKQQRTVTVSNLDAAFNAVTAALKANPEPPEVSLNPATWPDWVMSLVSGGGEFDPNAGVAAAQNQGLIGSGGTQPDTADTDTAAIEQIIADQHLQRGEVFLHTFADGVERQITVE